jgi:hypothetical protein
LLIIRSQHSPLPIEGENQLPASKKPKPFNEPLGPNNNGTDMAGASKHLVLVSSAPQDAGHGSLEHLIDGLNTECPYHAYILQEVLSYRAKETSANTMERFIIHHPGEQYALFTRPDNKKTSIYRECTCSFMRGDNFGFNEIEHKLAGEENDLLGYQVGL